MVVSKKDVQETIKSVYDKKDGFLNGVYPLYKLIQTFFINITQKDVELFLQGSVVKQLTTQAVRSLKPIISPGKDGIWSMDLIDQERWQSQNKGYRYILTVFLISIQDTLGYSHLKLRIQLAFKRN
jgi:hypothetical protein